MRHIGRDSRSTIFSASEAEKNGVDLEFWWKLVKSEMQSHIDAVLMLLLKMSQEHYNAPHFVRRAL
jgi:hypothetical protein